MKTNRDYLRYYFSLVFCVASVLVLYNLYNMYYRYVTTEHTDVNTHIYRAVAGGGYSLNSFIYGVSSLTGTNVLRTYIVYNLSIFVITVFALTICMKEYLYTVDGFKMPLIHALFIAIGLLFVCVIHTQFITPWYYRNNENPNLSPLGTQPWNSDTYNLMRMFSVVTVFLFLYIIKKISDENCFPTLWVLLFALFLLITYFAKPSFLICFMPSVFMLGLIDFVKKGKSILLKYCGIGVAFSVSLLIIPFQVDKLYGEASENGIIFTIERIQSVNIFSLGVLLMSIAFPLISTFLVLRFDPEKQRRVEMIFA